MGFLEIWLISGFLFRKFGNLAFGFLYQGNFWYFYFSWRSRIFSTSGDIYHRNWEFLKTWVFYPWESQAEIRDFSKHGDFYHGDSEFRIFFKSWNFYPGDFREWGFFRGRKFFCEMEIPPKSQFLQQRLYLKLKSFILRLILKILSKIEKLRSPPHIRFLFEMICSFSKVLCTWCINISGECSEVARANILDSRQTMKNISKRSFWF